MTDADRVAQPPLDRDEELDALELVVAGALERARKAGCDSAEVSAHSSQGLIASVRLGEVETLERTQDRGVGVTVFLGHQKGHSSSADLRPETIADCVDRAVDIARFTEEDPCNGLAEAKLMASAFPELDLWHPESLDAQRAIDRALACEQAGRDDPGIRNSEGAQFNAGLALGVYGNSHGFRGRSSGTRFGQSCVLIAGEGDRMQRDYSFDGRRSLSDLEAPEVTGREAASRTIRRLGARQIPTARMAVVLAPEVAKGLFGHLISAISGSSLYRNASFLKDSLGEQLFPDWLNVRERPLLRKGSGSAAFDAEGVATRERCIVNGGVLDGFVLSSYSARRLGTETTANAGGVRNLLIEPGGESLEDPIAAVEDGLYVTEVMGQGVSIVTGDYSRGAAGLRIRNGQLGEPVEEVTIAANLRDMFAGIRSCGAVIDDRGNVHCGPVLIEEMMIAGS